ncbi:hypothetical protein Q0Z83_011350 [Actinoplanes sichuanensis]|nr:hypothetical protein Q0Z83_011350 [Actinoplanes sichuanensis]
MEAEETVGEGDEAAGEDGEASREDGGEEPESVQPAIRNSATIATEIGHLVIIAPPLPVQDPTSLDQRRRTSDGLSVQKKAPTGPG